MSDKRHGLKSVSRPAWLFAIIASVTFFSFGTAATAASAEAPQGPPQQIIVKYRKPLQSALDAPGAANRSARAAEVLNTVSNRLDVRFEEKRELAIGAKLFRVERRANGMMRAQSAHMSEAELEDIARELSKDPDVLYAEPDRMLQPLATPNDSRYNEQWHYFEATGGLNVDDAWDQVDGSGVRVAVLDTGYRPHVDLDGNIVGGYDFISDSFVGNDGDGRDSDARDPGDWTEAGECGNGQPTQFRGSSWHGTHVAGTIAAETNNSAGVAGVAFGAKVVPLRVLGKCGGLTSDIADAIVWAAGGSVSGVPGNNYPAQVINMSLGGGGSCSSTTQSAINSARSNGAVVVVAAGNSNTDAGGSNPANCNGVVTVASTNRDGGRAYYSNYGSVVDVAAPGGELTQSTSVNGVLSTLNSGDRGPQNDTYSFYQGTSMAAPHVAGVAALLLEADSSLTPDGIESVLKSTTRAFPSTCSQCGTGIVDANAAVNDVLGGGGGDPDPGDTELENGVAETGLSGAQGEELRFTLEVPAGATDLSFEMSGGSGDADLYVKFGSEPTTSSYDCRPYVGGNDETCDISNVQAGTYHVMIRGYSSFSNTSLVGSFTEDSGGGGGEGELQNGVAETNLSGSQGSETFFTLDVPAGASDLSFNMSGGSGDADLYVKFGSAPTTSSYDCRPYVGGNNETCDISNVQAGTYHVMIRGYSSYSGVSLVGSFTEGSGGGGGSNFFENTSNVSIPDNGGYVESPINVDRTGDSGTVTIHVEIVHTYRGDLEVILVAPNGGTSTLESPSNDSGDNISKDYSINASGVDSSGTWKLRVRDTYSADTGYIDSWSITFP